MATDLPSPRPVASTFKFTSMYTFGPWLISVINDPKRDPGESGSIFERPRVVIGTAHLDEILHIYKRPRRR